MKEMKIKDHLIFESRFAVKMFFCDFGYVNVFVFFLFLNNKTKMKLSEQKK